jgi:type II secretory pathway pseudopilin PulG
MMRLKARRGAVVVMLGIMMVALVSVAAVAIDFSRLWALRNELQTAADAAAHAGAIQLLPPNNAGNTISAATSFANANKVMTQTASVDSVILGDWDDEVRSFTPFPTAPTTDAVSVTVSRQSTGLIMGLLGVSAPRMKARAIAWADAPVTSSAGCIKPVAIPYTQMMWRINQHRGIPNTPDDSGLYRPFDNVEDLNALNSMTVAQRTFSLKIGSGQVNDTLGQMSGSYQAVKLGKYWDASTGQLANPGPDNGGGDAYKGHLSGGTCYHLAVGDSLETESGNMAGPTICGAIGNPACNSASGPGICATLPGATDNTRRDDPTFGECRKADGSVGIDIKAAFYSCMTGCNGRSTVEVSLLGAFTLLKVYPDASQNNTTPVFEKSEIVGVFKPVADPGSVGPGATILRKPIIVR